MSWLLVTFKGGSPHPLDVSPLLSPLIPRVSCFCRGKGVNKNEVRDVENLLGGKFSSISEQNFYFVGFNPRQAGPLSKTPGLNLPFG